MIASIGHVDFSGLKPDFRSDLESMARDYYAVNREPLRVTSAFRSWEKQAELHLSQPGRAAAPGRSMHNYGLAVDIDSPQAEYLEKFGLLGRYKMVRPIKHIEPWHIERAGINYDLVRRGALVGGIVLLAALGYIILSRGA